jgi:TPR repeat protein
MGVYRIEKLLIIQVLVATVAALSAHADFESASSAYRLHDYNTAFQEFLPLAKNGDPRAQTIIAMMFKYGESVEQDHQQAFRWYLAAAEQGYPSAQRSLAELYESGRGVDADPEKAFYWFTQSAQQESQGEKQPASGRDHGDEAGRLSLSNPQAWSRKWDFQLPEKIPGNKEVSGSGIQSHDTGVYRVQLGAMKSSASANQLWTITHQPNQDLFQGLQPYIKSGSTETGSLYRVQAGPFHSLEEARHFCDALTRRDIETGCLPIRSIAEQD